ncbi:hydroxymyristoyl-ACP dehydratase [Dokdonella soli]|uniref:ApeI dehydratase-like domain-containing protein n=1 Tax=Dokdonella soli TaxID=529810 RepID=A0ABN1IGA7_9GAMM
MNGTPAIIQTVRISARHPSLPGHFPGNPVVPGVVLLDCIAAALERAGAGCFRRIVAVKFMAPLLPEQDAELNLTIDGARVRFRMERDGTPILSGEGELTWIDT